MPRVSPPTHPHLHDGQLYSALDYVEDNQYRRRILPKYSVWTDVVGASISQAVYENTLQNGGASISLEGDRPTEGYVIALPGSEQTVPMDTFSPEAIDIYVDQNREALEQPNRYLGTWVHDGLVFIDTSTVEQDFDTAYQLGKEYSQIAIYDLSSGEEIPITKDSDMAIMSAIDHQGVIDANAGTDLQGLPGQVNVPGYGPLQFHGNAELQNLANEYNMKNGLGAHPQDYVKVNPDLAARVAEAYNQVEHNPSDPQVRAAYDALIKETQAQYEHLAQNGYQFEFYPQDHDPYPNSPREAVLDLLHNKHMYVYPTAAGFGMDENPSDHPMLQQTPYQWNGQPVYANDLFRAVHDVYGHAKEGLGFRADGEDNAYRQHSAMFSPLAQQALANETRGQNSWVNYGPYGQQNQTANQGDTVYAQQKAGILPSWAADPNLYGQQMSPQTFSRVAALTRNQRLRQQQYWNDTFGEDRAPVAMGFPDGWSIREVNTPHASNYEGEMMGNCLGGANAQATMPQDENVHRPLNHDYTYYSVRDPENLPHATFAYEPNLKHFADLALEGRHGSNASRYTPYVHEFWKSKGHQPLQPGEWNQLEDSSNGNSEDIPQLGSPEHQNQNAELFQEKAPVPWWEKPDLNGIGEYYRRAVKPLQKAMQMPVDEGEAFLRKRLVNNFKPQTVEYMVSDYKEQKQREHQISPDSISPYTLKEFPEFYWVHGNYGPEAMNVIKDFQNMHRGMSWNDPRVWQSGLTDNLIQNADMDPSVAEQLAARWVNTHLQAQGGGESTAPQTWQWKPGGEDMWNTLKQYKYQDQAEPPDELRYMFQDYAPDPNYDQSQLWKELPRMPQTFSANQKLALTTPWGQDWDEWQATKPNYIGESGHKIGYDPSIHQEGKGFILNNGDVWTWPTANMRPQHMDMAAQARAQGGVLPGTAFHIKNGQVWTYGDRTLDKDQRHSIRNADPRLDPYSWFNRGAPQPEVQADGYGHADKLIQFASRCPVCQGRPYNACPGCVRVAALPDWANDGDWEDDLDSYLNNYEVYPWQRGNHGKFLVTPQGEFVHWQTNDWGEPHHDSVAAEWGKQQALKGDIAPNGAWWVTDTYHQNPASLLNQATPQAQRAGLAPSVRGYVAKKLDICTDCMKPLEECQCKGGWVDNYPTDQLRDLKPEYGGTS